MERGRIIRDKTAQFYLVAAIIVVSVIMGIVVVYNYAKGGEPPTSVNDARDEIYIEGKKVMSYGGSQGYNQAQFDNLFADFTDSYVDYLEGEKSVYFLFGSLSSMTIAGYQEKAREVIAISGSQNTSITDSDGEFTESITPQSNKLTLSIDDLQYEFLVLGGQNFYFIVSDIIGDSEYIAKG